MSQFKITKFSFLFPLFLLFGLSFLTWPLITGAASGDAIAIRITENPYHYSSLRWYQSQKLEGSPQLLQIDGYEAVRNGRTVYVDVANVVDKNNDGLPDFLDTNIFIISYNQDAQDMTFDIFGQMLKNLKFNTNLPNPGTCSKTVSSVCVNDNECPVGEYCDSKKAKVTRDVRRLADLVEIKTQLDVYRQKTGRYPALLGGTYLTNKTVSTWPSWQQNLNQDLGITLPVDPINQLGACPNFDPLTCWDQSSQKFAADLSQLILPSGSHAYVYSGDSQGKTARYCAQTESGYKNIDVFNCFNDKKQNNPPVIKGINLNGQPKQEFSGYVSFYDLDGDPVKMTLDLVSPTPSDWIKNGWQWAPGLNKFSIVPLAEIGQRKISAAKTGTIQAPGYYKIRLTLDDGQGEANSVVSGIYDVSVNPFSATLAKVAKSIVIGSSATLTMAGLDSNQNPITNLFFDSATYSTSTLTQAALANHGFILSGLNLLENFKSVQHTGVYDVNVYAQDSNSISAHQVDSKFTVNIINNPPALQKLTATFSNKATKICNPGEQCIVSIDNSEAAKIEIKGSDPDGQSMNYSLVDDLGGKLSIDANSGVISGLEKLNFQGTADQTFDISVRIADQYCANSSEEECSIIYSFSVLVKKYCSIAAPESTLHINISKSSTINNSGEVWDTGANLTDCSAVAPSSVDINYVGKANSKAIVLISDLSKSMDTNITSNGVTETAINRLKSALTDSGTGFLDRVYKIINNWPSDFSIKIGLVAYNSKVVSFQNLINLALPGSLANLKQTINTYTTDYQTNTLVAFNKAEEILSSITDSTVEKIIILMSDGIPGVDGYVISNPHCEINTCDCGGTWPNCTECCTQLCLYSTPKSSPKCKAPEVCKPIVQYSFCGKCYDYTCSCGGTYPNCIPDRTDCPPGQLADCNTCYTPPPPPHSVYNTNMDWKEFFSSLFKVEPAGAATTQSQCIYQSCEKAFPNFHCYGANEYMACNYAWTLNCDLTGDVNAETNTIKNSGISIYTIYYDTAGTSVPKQKMCDWSSNNGVDCDNNVNTFAGTDINTMINKVLGRIVTKPKDVKVGSYSVIDPEPTAFTNTAVGTKIDGLNCGVIRPIVTYSSNGYLEFSNLQLNYCPAKLHP